METKFPNISYVNLYQHNPMGIDSGYIDVVHIQNNLYIFVFTDVASWKITYTLR